MKETNINIPDKKKSEEEYSAIAMKERPESSSKVYHGHKEEDEIMMTSKCKEI